MRTSAYSILTVIIVADDSLVWIGLSNLLEGEGISVIVGAFKNSLDIKSYDADVILWDADPELDTEAVGQQELPVLALISEDGNAIPLLAAGASGVLYRTATATQIAIGLSAVAAGLSILELGLFQPLLPAVTELDTSFDDLTPREVDVLGLVSEGLPNKQIAKKLGISVNTVKFHVNALLSKFGVKSRTELAVRAVQQGQTYL